MAPADHANTGSGRGSSALALPFFELLAPRRARAANGVAELSRVGVIQCAHHTSDILITQFPGTYAR